MQYTLPKNYERAFKDADIRGVYPNEINAGVAYRAARAFVELHAYTTVVVGSDMRLSSPELHAACIAGARKSGAQIIDLGLVATPQLYFASGSLGLPGVMITASHSPKEYNGLKLVHAGAVSLTRKTGLTAMLRAIKKDCFVDAQKEGNVTKKSIDAAYQKFVLAGMRPKRYAGLRIATDIGNGMAHDIIPLLSAKLPIQFDTLFNTVDGRFPNRDSDPNLMENQVALRTKLETNQYDFGISFDGDADRIAFLDEKGHYVNSAAIGALIASRILLREPGAAIASTNLNSRIYEETIKKQGGRVVMARTGHTFVKEAMRKHVAVFGCEYSGHFFYRDFFYTDSVVYTLREVLDAYLEAKGQGKTFGEMMAQYLVYHQTEDIVISVADRDVAMDAVFKYLQSLQPKTIKKFDGYFVDFGDVWGAVKMSVTEYAIKLMFESADSAKAKKMQKQIATFVKSIRYHTA